MHWSWVVFCKTYRPSCAWLPLSLLCSTSRSPWSCCTWTCSSSHLLLHCCSFWCNSCLTRWENLLIVLTSARKGRHVIMLLSHQTEYAFILTENIHSSKIMWCKNMFWYLSKQRVVHVNALVWHWLCQYCFYRGYTRSRISTTAMGWNSTDLEKAIM